MKELSRNDLTKFSGGVENETCWGLICFCNNGNMFSGCYEGFMDPYLQEDLTAYCDPVGGNYGICYPPL